MADIANCWPPGRTWPVRTGATGCARWFEDTGCDALVLEREVLEPSAHAASWLRQTEPPGQWQPEYDEWMAYYERHRIEAVGFGLITMRKRAAGNAWFRAEEAPQDWSMPCGDHLGAVFELADFLDGYPRRSDCSTSRCGSHPTWSSTSGPGRISEGWRVTDRMLRQTAGLCREGQVDEAVAAIVAACDGTRPLGAVLAEAARAADADPSDLARAALPVVHRLVERGFLLPAVE